jgi:hypothetical protein
VENFIASRSGTSKFIMEFVIVGDYLKQKIDVDVYRCIVFFKIVVYTQLYVTNRLIYHPSSYVGYGEKLGNWAKEKGELKDSVVNFVRKKFKMFSNVQEVLVPLQ